MVTNDSAVVSQEKDNVLPPPEPFYVVLVDIKQTIDTDHIHCTKVPLESGADLKYVAISYRWGELPEQIVPTVDYIAHITSFDIKDFILLCELISEEPELREMQYVWVDAICVDQMNETRKKETIFRMNDIYDQANYILAVPDLHLAYLKKNPSNCETIECMEQNAILIYHIMQQNHTELHALDDETLDKWEVPEEKRADITSYVADFLPDDVECYYLRKPLGITPTHYEAFHEKFSTWPPDKIVTEIFEAKHVYYGEEMEGFGSVFSTQSAKTSPHQDRAEQSNLDVEEKWWNKTQYHFQQIIIMLQVHKWNIRFKERRMMIDNVLEFFKYLVKDWSDRVWVISEYHISKKKQKLMLWFLSFAEYYKHTFKGYPFFQVRFPSSGGNQSSEEDDDDDDDDDGDDDDDDDDDEDKDGDDDDDDDDDGDKDEEPKEKIKLAYASTQLMMKQGINFSEYVKSALTHRSFLRLLLGSKASRNEDRFNAVLPLSAAHRPYLKDQDTVSQWKITDMVSVRMRVRQWFTAKENLIMLYSMWTYDSQQIVIPSFDCVNFDFALHGVWDGLKLHGLFEHSAKFYNFDLQQLANESSSTCLSASMVDENDTTASPSLLRYSIHIQPRQYQVQRIYYLETEPFVSNISVATWKTLQLNPYHDALAYVQIPLLYLDSSDKEEAMKEKKGYPRIALVGSMEKNRWVTVGHSFTPGEFSFSAWPCHNRDTHHTEGELILHENTEGLRFNIY